MISTGLSPSAQGCKPPKGCTLILPSDSMRLTMRAISSLWAMAATGWSWLWPLMWMMMLSAASCQTPVADGGGELVDEGVHSGFRARGRVCGEQLLDKAVEALGINGHGVLLIADERK